MEYWVGYVIEDNYEQIVLKMYWGKGNRFSKGRLPEMFLLRTPNEETRRGIGEALESLKRKELLFKEGHYWFVNDPVCRQVSVDHSGVRYSKAGIKVL